MKNLQDVEFIIFDKQAGRSALTEFKETMRGRRFDVLLHMQAALRASRLSRCITAPIKLGFDRQRARDFQWLFSTHKIAATPGTHVLESFFEFLQALGLKDRELEWNLPLSEDDRNWATTHFADTGPLLVINPCSSVRNNNWRNWPAENYPAVIAHAAKRGLKIVLTGGPSAQEQAFAAEICAASDENIENLVGKTSLGQLAALISQARVLIAPDTGPGHIATMYSVPVIGLFASSNPLRAGPYLSQQYLVNKYPQAVTKYLKKNVSAIKWGTRVRRPDVMSLIKVEDVIARLDEVIPSPIDP